MRSIALTADIQTSASQSKSSEMVALITGDPARARRDQRGRATELSAAPISDGQVDAAREGSTVAAPGLLFEAAGQADSPRERAAVAEAMVVVAALRRHRRHPAAVADPSPPRGRHQPGQPDVQRIQLHHRVGARRQRGRSSSTGSTTPADRFGWLSLGPLAAGPGRRPAGAARLPEPHQRVRMTLDRSPSPPLGPPPIPAVARPPWRRRRRPSAAARPVVVRRPASRPERAPHPQLAALHRRPTRSPGFEDATGYRVEYVEQYDDNYRALDRRCSRRSARASRSATTSWSRRTGSSTGCWPTDWLEPIPIEHVPNRVNIDPDFLGMPWDRGARFHLPWQVGITGIAYIPERTGRADRDGRGPVRPGPGRPGRRW